MCRRQVRSPVVTMETHNDVDKMYNTDRSARPELIASYQSTNIHRTMQIIEDEED